MLTLITIFYASLLVLLAMILLKRREINTGKPNFISRFGRATDNMFETIFSHGGRAVSMVNRRTFIGILQWVAFHLLLWIRNIYVAVKARFMQTSQGKKLIDAVRGRGEVKNHGASFYLRRISADNQTK